MIGSRSLLVALISAGFGAAALQVVHAATPAAHPSVQKLDDDQYPHMRRALHDLRAARDTLQEAEPRFKGHRDKAIEHVDQAIQQCVDALAEG
jgi:ABC-type sugar transport system substrate-binding protein